MSEAAPRKNERDFLPEEAVKNVRALYFKNQIAIDTRGKKGEFVTLDSLWDRDLKTLRYIADHGENVPPELRRFANAILKDGQYRSRN